MENADGSIFIQWTQGDVLPQQLVYLLSDSTSTHATRTSESCCNNDCLVEEVDEEFNEVGEDCESITSSTSCLHLKKMTMMTNISDIELTVTNDNHVYAFLWYAY